MQGKLDVYHRALRSIGLAFVGFIAINTVSWQTLSAQTATFTGPYVGVYGGYGAGHSSQHDGGFIYTPPAPPVVVPPVVVPPPPPVAPAPANIAGDGSYGLHGGLGGGFVGYNYQFMQVVVGLEGDIGTSSSKGSSFACGTPAHQCGTNVDTTADVRARIGLPCGQFMPFIAGGLALADIAAYDNLFGSQGRDFRAGYTIGGGLEYKITPQLALRVEYLHSQFDQAALFAIVPGVPERISATTDVVRGGLVYSFFTSAPAVVARY